MRHPSRRLPSALAASLVAMSTWLQLGCGVLHCTAPVAHGSQGDVPSCHARTSAERDADATHEPGEGTGACCVVAPLENSPSSSSIAHSHEVAFERVPLAGTPATPQPGTPVPAIDTGPPRAPFSGAAVPLRV